MRILYQHRTLGDGAEGVHIIEMVKAFRRLGHDVEILGAEVTPSRSGTQRPSLIQSVRRAVPAAAFESAQFATSTATYFSVRRKIHAFRPHFVYKRHAKFDFGTVLAARHSAVPIILEINCVYSAESIQRYEPVSFPRFLTRVERWIFDNADENIVVSTPLKEELRHVAAKADAVVMSNGVDHRLFVPNDDAGSQIRESFGLDGQTVIGFVGTLWKWHGLDLLVDAFSKIADASPVRLLIVGDGEMKEELRALALSKGVENRVIFTGRVPHKEVVNYVAAMDVAVLPAEHRAHASPMKVIEYMAVGKPVVAPRLPNLQEILTDGVDGILFDAANVDALSGALRSVIGDIELRRRISRAARSKVEDHLNWDSNARKVIEIYEQIQRR